MKTNRCQRQQIRWFFVAAALLASCAGALAQDELPHERGRLWELVRNDGWIGSLGSWDFLVSSPLGLFPGFNGYVHPVGNENDAVNTYENANMHDFRSGCWILAKNLLTPGTPPSYTPTPTDYELYVSGLQQDAYGVETKRQPIQLIKNYNENAGYDPLLPEEMTSAQWNTNLGITITRRSYVWSFPGYSDFIIYDYSMKNTGIMVSTLTGVTVPGYPQQTLRNVRVVFQSGISVSTKSQINFHADLTAIQAGAFGWQPGAYHDFYHILDKFTLFCSTNYNGGARPLPWDPYPVKSDSAWQQKFGAELESPSAFGWLALYASPTGAAPRISPTPDVLRIDSHKGGTFQGQSLDLEFLTLASKTKQYFYDYASTPDTQAALGNTGNRLNFYTLSYGPYTLAPGDSLRFIVAEIAGVMDYNDVIAGDPNHHFPDSTIAAIERNAANARNAVSWGLGATENGIPLAAAVPPPPPGPHTDAVNASFGTQQAAIGVTWDKTAETTQLSDGGGNTFYHGLSDLDGYRIYRSTDFQYASETQPPVFRGAAWHLLADIPKARFADYWDAELGKYRYVDSNVTFGFKYGYYVSSYRLTPSSWTSPNGQVVTTLPAMESGSANRTFPTSAAPGPVASFDIFVVPNPYVYNDARRSFGITDPYRIEFRNLPERCTIRIYTIMGDLVRVLEHQPDARGDVFGSEAWDQKSTSGLLVAPGLYLYNIQSTTPGLDKKLTGKLMIIR